MNDFLSLGEFLQAVARATMGHGIDDRLAAASGTNEKFPSEGGFLVPTEHSVDLLEKLYMTGSILSRCRRLPVTKGGKLTVPAIDENARTAGSRFGGLQTYWPDEAETVTATKPKFRGLDFNLKKLFGLGYATEELLSDATALGAIIEHLFILEATFNLENEIIVGEGAGRPLGILNSDALITVGAESGQGSATIQAANVVNMWARMWGPSRARAVWLINQDVETQLYGLTWSTGTALVPLFKWADDGTPLLMGRPVLPVEYCPTLGSAGDIILADPGEYVVAEKQAAFTPSLHVRFLHDEMTFRFSLRVDGSPAWTSPLTPLNGSATLSPFVALEAR